MMGYIKELCSLKTLHTQGRKTEVMLDDEHGKHLSLNIVFTDAAGKDNVQFYALSDAEALARGKIYCENWRSEEYCSAWTWYQLAGNFDAMVGCYQQYPAIEELIGFQQCIEGFATLDV